MRIASALILLLGIWTVPAAAEDIWPVDQNGSLLTPIADCMPIEAILEAYGASTSVNDPMVSTFLESVIDLVSSDIRDGDNISISGVSVSTLFDTEGNLAEESLEISASMGDLLLIAALTSTGSGNLRLYFETLDSEYRKTSEHKCWLQLYSDEVRQIAPIIALPGSCKCSKKGVTGCTKTMCDDGSTCPNNNGESCGYYTRSIDD